MPIELLEKIFLTVFPLLMIVTVGYAYAKRHAMHMDSVNAANIDIFIPALLFSVLSAESFDFNQYTEIAIASAVIVLGSGLILLPLFYWSTIQAKTFLPPMMFNNSGNLGLPLALLAFGPAALPAAIVLFIVENLLHFTVGAYILNRKQNLWQVLRLPMVVATVLGFFWGQFDLPLNNALRTGIDMLGQISIPLMLFALGVRITDIQFTYWRIGLLGAILCPLSGLMMGAIAIAILPIPEEQVNYVWLFAVLPPALLNFMLAERYQQEPDKVAAIVLFGNIASLLVIPFMLFFIL